METVGRRVPPSTAITELEPGDYRWDGPDGGLILWGMAPSGEVCRIDERWLVQEHEDGTVSVGPTAPGEAYSIWINKPDGWHGFLERGVWKQHV